MVRKYDIWVEGYLTTGMDGIPARAQKAASGVHAESFKAACDKHFKGDKYYDSEKCRYWGCRLFDNKEDARDFERRFYMITETH